MKIYQIVMFFLILGLFLSQKSEAFNNLSEILGKPTVVMPVRHLDRPALKVRKSGILDDMGVCNITYLHSPEDDEANTIIVWSQIQDCIDQGKDKVFLPVEEKKGVKIITFYILENIDSVTKVFTTMYGEVAFDKALGRYGLSSQGFEYSWAATGKECINPSSVNCKLLAGFQLSVGETNIVVASKQTTFSVGHEVSHVFKGNFHYPDGSWKDRRYLYTHGIDHFAHKN